MSQFYTELCNMFIRPTRQKYNLHDLGNPMISSTAKRKDFQVKTHHDFTLKCSFFQNSQAKQFKLSNQEPYASPICVIYLHSFNGSRLQSIRYSHALLQKGYHFCCFDFAGSGLSEGQYVSLGFHQSKDLLNVIKHLVENFGICNFFLWGRSMGSSTIIKFCEYFQNVKKQLQSRLIQRNLLRMPSKNNSSFYKFQSEQRTQKLSQNMNNKTNERKNLNKVYEFEGKYNYQQQRVKSKSNPKTILTTTSKFNTESRSKFDIQDTKQYAQKIERNQRKSQSIKNQLQTLTKIKILCAVLDSPFCSLNRLAIEIAQNRISVPQIFIQAVFMVIKNTIQKKVDFKVSELQLLPILKHMNFPTFIFASNQDSLIKHKHSQDIYEGLSNRGKQFIFIKGQHHQMRGDDVIDKIFKFFDKCVANISKNNLASSLVQRKEVNCERQSNYHLNQNQVHLRDSQLYQFSKEQILDRKIYVKSHSRNKLSEQFSTPLFTLSSNKQCQKVQQRRVQPTLNKQVQQGSKDNGNFMRHTLDGSVSPSLIKSAFISQANLNSHLHAQGRGFNNFPFHTKNTNILKHRNVCFMHAISSNTNNSNISKKKNEIITQQKIRFQQSRIQQQSHSHLPKNKLWQFSKVRQQIKNNVNSDSKTSKVKFTPVLNAYAAFGQGQKQLSSGIKTIKDVRQKIQLHGIISEAQNKGNRSNQLTQHFSIHKVNPIKMQCFGRQKEPYTQQTCKSARLIRGQSDFANKVNNLSNFNSTIGNSNANLNPMHMNIVSTKIKKRHKEVQREQKYNQKITPEFQKQHCKKLEVQMENILTVQSQQSQTPYKKNYFGIDLKRIVEKKFQQPKINYSQSTQTNHEGQQRQTEKKIKKKSIQNESLNQKCISNHYQDNLQHNQRLLQQRNCKANIYNTHKTSRKKTYRFHTVNHFDSIQHQQQNYCQYPTTIHKNKSNSISLKNLIGEVLMDTDAAKNSKNMPDISFYKKKQCQQNEQRNMKKEERKSMKTYGITPSIASFQNQGKNGYNDNSANGNQNQRYIVLKSPKKKSNNIYHAQNTTK